jgi:hypothetical protein
MKPKYAIVYTGERETKMFGQPEPRYYQIAYHYNIERTYVLHKNALKGFDNLISWYGRTFDFDIARLDREIEYNTLRLDSYQKRYQTAAWYGENARAGQMKRQVNRMIACIAKDRELLAKTLKELALFHVKPVPFSIIEVDA